MSTTFFTFHATKTTLPGRTGQFKRETSFYAGSVTVSLADFEVTGLALAAETMQR